MIKLLKVIKKEVEICLLLKNVRKPLEKKPLGKEQEEKLKEIV